MKQKPLTRIQWQKTPYDLAYSNNWKKGNLQFRLWAFQKTHRDGRIYWKKGLATTGWDTEGEPVDDCVKESTADGETEDEPVLDGEREH